MVGKDGFRKAYFSGEPTEQTVQEMAGAERSGAAMDMDEAFARNILKKGKRFKGDTSRCVCFISLSLSPPSAVA